MSCIWLAKCKVFGVNSRAKTALKTHQLFTRTQIFHSREGFCNIKWGEL